MKLLLDEDLPHPAVGVLRTSRTSSGLMPFIGLHAADDLQIVTTARSDERTVVALNADFHAIMAVPGEQRPSVIRIRIEGLHWQPLAELIARVANSHREAIEAGALISVREHDVRIRRLPIRS